MIYKKKDCIASIIFLFSPSARVCICRYNTAAHAVNSTYPVYKPCHCFCLTNDSVRMGACAVIWIRNKLKTTSIDINIFHPILAGHRLTDNVIRELNTPGLLECALYCIRKPSECKSINCRATKRQDYSINCQLINATITTHPQNLQADENYDNYELITEMVFL